VFDKLTLDQLYTLHTSISHHARQAHERIMDGLKPRVPVFSDEWALHSAHADELRETASAVYDEITRREMADA
jgi:hypothetical protein